MSPETESRAPSGRPALVEIEPEQEVDLGRYWSALIGRWWLPVLAVVLGVLIGFLVATTGNNLKYQAQAIVYLGQPFAPGGSVQIQSLPTRLGFVGQIVVSQAVLKRVSAQVGIPPTVLGKSVETKSVSPFQRGKVDVVTPLVAVTVTHSSARKAADAANAFAKIVAQNFSTYVDVKLGVYQARLARDQRELNRVTKTIADAQAQQQRVLNDRSLGVADRLVVLGNYNNVLTFNQNRQTELEQGMLTLKELISLATEVERARVVEPAAARKEAPPSRRSAAVVGAVIGLILGVLAALFWEPLTTRLKSRPRPAQ